MKKCCLIGCPESDDFLSIENVLITFLTGIILLTMGPVAIAWPEIPMEWPAVVSQLCILITLGGIFFYRKYFSEFQRSFIYLCGVYIVLLLIVGAIHTADLFSINKYTIVNVSGDIVNGRKEQELAFTFRYLLFPILLVLQIIICRQIDLGKFAFIAMSTFIINLGIVYYQEIFDRHFLNKFPQADSQVNGLCTDPNALSMCSYLLIILLLSAFFIVKNRATKTIFVLVIALLFGAMAFAGGRSMSGGLLFFITLFPLVIALGHSNWIIKKRILIGSISLIFFISLIVSIPLLVKTIKYCGTAGERLALTYHKYEQNGLLGILCKDELRGELFSVGISLIKKAPLAGWGPAGYFREYSNQVYLDSETIKPAPDMVLNHYLMIAVDFGVPLLILNLILLLIPIIGACYCLKYENNAQQRMSILVLVFGNCVFMLMINMIPPSYYPEVVWLWTGQLAFLVTYAAKSICFQTLSFSKFQIPAIITACLGCILVILGAYETSYGKAGYKARKDYAWWPVPPYNYNDRCYLPDILDGNEVRWCRKGSSLQIPIIHYAGQEVTISFDNQYPDLRGTPVTFEYGGKKGVDSKMVLRKKGWNSFKIPLDENHVYKYCLKNGEERKFLVVSINPSRTWIPRKHGIADDRELGILVSIPKL